MRRLCEKTKKPRRACQHGSASNTACFRSRTVVFRDAMPYSWLLLQARRLISHLHTMIMGAGNPQYRHHLPSSWRYKPVHDSVSLDSPASPESLSGGQLRVAELFVAWKEVGERKQRTSKIQKKKRPRIPLQRSRSANKLSRLCVRGDSKIAIRLRKSWKVVHVCLVGGFHAHKCSGAKAKAPRGWKLHSELCNLPLLPYLASTRAASCCCPQGCHRSVPGRLSEAIKSCIPLLLHRLQATLYDILQEHFDRAADCRSVQHI